MSQFLTDRNDIEAWLRRYRVQGWRINADSTVDIDDDFDISHKKLSKLPIQLRNVEGNINLSGCGLTTMLGLPDSMKRNVFCNENRLTSLEGCPRRIEGMLTLHDNELTSLVGIADVINFADHISLDGNPIIDGGLGLLLIEGLEYISLSDIKLNNIFNHHLMHDKDIFACQQALIDAGLEEYAVL